MNPLDQALADLSTAEQALNGADAAKKTNDDKLAAAQAAKLTTDTADADAETSYNAKADAAIAAITASKRAPKIQNPLPQ